MHLHFELRFLIDDRVGIHSFVRIGLKFAGQLHARSVWVPVLNLVIGPC